MINKDIKIRNRYGYYHILSYIEENKYRLIPDTYMRLIYDDKKDIYAIDPEGGPLITHNTLINDLQIVKIQQEPNGIFLYLKEN